MSIKIFFENPERKGFAKNNYVMFYKGEDKIENILMNYIFKFFDYFNKKNDVSFFIKINHKLILIHKNILKDKLSDIISKHNNNSYLEISFGICERNDKKIDPEFIKKVISLNEEIEENIINGYNKMNG